MSRTLRIAVAAIVALSAGAGIGASSTTTPSAPSQPQPYSIVCEAGSATLEMAPQAAASPEQALTLYAWPASKATTFQVAVAGWDGSLSLHLNGGEMTDGKAEVRSKVPIAITAKRAQGSGPVKFTLTLFGNSKCEVPVPPPPSRHRHPVM